MFYKGIEPRLWMPFAGLAASLAAGWLLFGRKKRLKSEQQAQAAPEALDAEAIRQAAIKEAARENGRKGGLAKAAKAAKAQADGEAQQA
jgi:LPXTG-motif cell wall-anchored protein